MPKLHYSFLVHTVHMNLLLFPWCFGLVRHQSGNNSNKQPVNGNCYIEMKTISI